MSNIEIKLANGKTKKYESAVMVKEVAKQISPSLAKKSVYALLNNQKVALSTLINHSCKLRIVTIDDEIDADINYFCKEMLIKILQEKFNDFKIINSKVDFDYFYIDFDYSKTFKKNDILTLNNKLHKFVKHFVPDKTFWINNTKFFTNFKIIDITGHYLDGDKTKKVIHRLKGIVAYSKIAMEQKEADIKKRLEIDHRIIGKNLKIFMFSGIIGAGLPIWLPNGVLLKKEIEKFIKQKELEYNFREIQTPILGTKEMYLKSGHLMHYQDDMFSSIKTRSEEFLLRPMTCPHHITVFKNDLYSYRDLPVRFAEHAYLFRYEPSGSLTGLERVRMMQLTDSHIFVRLDQLKAEFKNCFELISDVLKSFNIKIDYFSLSTRDKKNSNKFFNDDKMWDFAESKLKEVLKEMKIPYKLMPGEAAFYGPKLDVQIQTVLKHEITISTIQFDLLTAKNFEATYIDCDGKKKYPAIIHRGLIGTYERFIAILLEQTKGILPLWLVPEQVRILPVSDDVFDYALAIKATLSKKGIRVTIDHSNERLTYKIRTAQINKIPYQLIIGKKEQATETITYREYHKQTDSTTKLDDLINEITKKVQSKASR